MVAMLYFAYGSNLSSRQMQARCPGAIPVGPARLDSYALVFDRPSRRWGGHAADVVPAADGDTWGFLWQVDDRHLAALDRFEGVHTGGYARETVALHGPGRLPFPGEVYRVVSPGAPGMPSPRYLHTILEGAREHGLPAHWLAHLASFGRGSTGPAAVR